MARPDEAIKVVCICATSFLIILFITKNHLSPETLLNHMESLKQKITAFDAAKVVPLNDFQQYKDKLKRDFWQALKSNFTCPSNLFERIGNKGDGGKWTCGISTLGKVKSCKDWTPCTIYSFGVKTDDSSFEAEMLQRTTCNLFAYDPSVDQIANPLTPNNPRVSFTKIGIGGKNDGDKKTLSTLMKEHEVEWIDLLKMDVEAGEYPAFENIFKEFPTSLPFGQLLLEMHIEHEWKEEDTKMLIEFMENLEKRGMRLFSTEINDQHPDSCQEFSFLNMEAVKYFLEEGDIEKLMKN